MLELSQPFGKPINSCIVSFSLSLPGVMSRSTLRATYSNWSMKSLRKQSVMLMSWMTTSSKPRWWAQAAVMWCDDEMEIWFGVSMLRQHRLNAISSDQQFWRSRIWSSVCGKQKHTQPIIISGRGLV